jgi:membrane-associated phospholipid phosphatase
VSSLVVPRERPTVHRLDDLPANASFPSGHTAAAFAAAASILERRGPAEGIPALALASFVGVARVEAHKHHWYDALAGAGIGTASGLILTHPLADKRIALAPWVDSTGGGASFDMAF